MESILKSLTELEGVHGAILSDSNGRVLAFQAHSIYDADLLAQVSRAIASALDSIKLMHEEWDSVTTQFADGKLLIRKVNLTRGNALCLAVIADARLNSSFAGVAIRVAVAKLNSLADSGAELTAVATPKLPVANPAGPPASAKIPTQAATVPIAVVSAGSAAAPPAPFKTRMPEVATSGLSWSGLGSSTLSASGVTVKDPASSAALTACTQALARNVGPMAKVFVKEAVRKLCGDRPFSKDQTSALVAELSKSIDDPSDAAQFKQSALKAV